MKLGTNINRHQTMCREQEPTFHLHFLWNYGPLKFFLWKLCPLYNFNTDKNIFMKPCTNINHHHTKCREYQDTVKNIFVKLCRNINLHQTMCREKEPTLHLHFLRNSAPLKFFLWKSCPLCNFNTDKNIFMKPCTNINHHHTKCREIEP